MFTCKQCGRKFKSSQGLAGHVSGAHSQKQNEDLPETDVQAAELGVAELVEEEEPGIGEQIRYYISKDYDFDQLVKKFGFKPTSIRREMEKMIKPASEDTAPR